MSFPHDFDISREQTIKSIQSQSEMKLMKTSYLLNMYAVYARRAIVELDNQSNLN